MKKITKQEILDSAHKTAESIREYVRQQLPDWQKIPYLAARACAAQSDEYNHIVFLTAFRHGLWRVDAMNTDVDVNCYVDLESGALYKVNYTGRMNDDIEEIALTNDRVLMGSITYGRGYVPNLNLFKAGEVIDYLNRVAGWCPKEMESFAKSMFDAWVKTYSLQENSYKRLTSFPPLQK